MARLNTLRTRLAIVFSTVVLVTILFLSSAPTIGQNKADQDEAQQKFPAKLSSDLPYDVDQIGTINALRANEAGIADPDDRDAAYKAAIPVEQRLFDITAWKAFIALNWPVNSEGKPLPTLDSPDKTPRVWSFWRSADSIFLPQGAKPEPWATVESGEDLYRAKGAWRQNTTNADENFQAFSGPLIDQNGKWVRYEVRVNKEEFNYIYDNGLYSLEGQEQFNDTQTGRDPSTNPISFPLNTNENGVQKHGAIEVKLAWKELGPNDDPKRFYTTYATITPSNPGVIAPDPKKILMGLVGMHISMRTQSSPQWIWSTFEQVDNCGVDPGDLDSQGRPLHANFNNPNSLTTPINLLSPKNAVIDPKTGAPVYEPDPTKATTWIESKTTTPTQVQRIIPITKETAELNRQVQKLLANAGSKLRYYELVGTQWPEQPDSPAIAGGSGSAPESIDRKTPGRMTPTYLTNMTMETFFQKGTQEAGPLEQDDRLPSGSPSIDPTSVFGTESCVGCHYSAGSCVAFKKDQYKATIDPKTGEKEQAKDSEGNLIPNVYIDSAGGHVDSNGYLLDAIGKRIPIYGENSHGGNTGSGEFSWLLQIEAKSTHDPALMPVNKTAAQVNIETTAANKNEARQEN